MSPTLRREALLLRLAVGLAGCVPVAAGAGGALYGLPVEAPMDNHYRYLCGLLLGIGLAFWASIPTIEQHGARFRLLTFIVVTGGLTRLLGMVLGDWPGWPMAATLIMELGVTPLLCLWQARIARAKPWKAECLSENILNPLGLL